MKNFSKNASPKASNRLMNSVILALMVIELSCAQEDRSTVNFKADPTPMSVCELFANIQLYQGKLVTIRGIYYSGLRQNNCPQVFKTDNHAWPAALDLVDSHFTSEGYLPARFVTDIDSWNKLDEVVVDQGKIGKRVEVWVTVVGKLRGPKKYDTAGKPTGMGGFGHLGAFPAQIVVQRVYDIVVKPNPTYDYYEMLPRNVRRSK